MNIIITDKSHTIHAHTICQAIEAAAQVCADRGRRRPPGRCRGRIEQPRPLEEVHTPVLDVEDVPRVLQDGNAIGRHGEERTHSLEACGINMNGIE